MQERFSDTELIFYQEATFFWLTGWEKPDSLVAIDISTGETILYIPKYDESYEIWTGPIPSTDSIKLQTGVSDVRFISSFNKEDYQNTTIFTANDQVVDEKLHIDQKTFVNAFALARRVKSRIEIETLTIASQKTCESLNEVVKFIKPGAQEIWSPVSF